jgi:hypothetical protein
MDVPLYAIALVVFSILYLAIGVFLGYTIVITLMVMLLYITLRYHKLPEDYPHGTGDVMITVIFIGVTWGIFTYLGPKDPIPFLPTASGQGLTYTHAAINLLPYISISLVLLMFFLLVGGFMASQFRSAFAGKGGGTPATGDNKPKQGVGA